MPDNVNTLAIGRDDSSINMIDLRTLGKIGKYKEKNNHNSISSLQFSKSGRLIFSCSQNKNSIVAWDTLTEQKVGEFGPDVHHDGVKSIGFSHDGQTLYSAGKGGVIAIWNQL